MSALDEEGDGLITPRAETALVGFMTGGLPGLLRSLDSEGASFENDVDDPEALRRAEDAVARQSRDGQDVTGNRAPAPRPIDEPWAPVATQMSPGNTAGLDDVVRALESDGVDFGWDPYDPRDVVNFMPPSAGLTARKLFSVVVPVSQVGRARESLYGDPPAGVTYAWQTAGPVSARPVETPASDQDFDFGSSPAPKRQMSKDGIPLSDNDRFARMASGGPSAAVMIVIVFIVVGTLLAVGGVLLTVLNG
jgi:hypothetical protein